MFDLCPSCGEVRFDVTVDSIASEVICPACGHREPFHPEPLLVVSGAGGAGKSSVLRELRGTREDVVLLDSDVLWREEFWDELEWYFRTWLLVCRDVAQSRHPPVLFGAGFGVPENLEAHPQHEFFSAIHYCVLVCDDDELERRLRARPADRNPDRVDVEQYTVEEQVEYNRWLKDAADREEFTALDTTDATVEETAAAVDRWITSRVTAG